MLDRTTLCKLIPHSGTMCLIDTVSQWDETQIICLSNTHKQSNHPLHSQGKLPSSALIEYSAQAMAIHSSLIDQTNQKQGYLVGLRNVKLTINTLCHLTQPLCIKANQKANSSLGMIYDFTVSVEKDLLISGQATIIKNQA